LQPEHLREYGKVAEGDNLFAVNIAAVRANLERAPRIRSAEVHRDLPDTLVIRVLERSALGRLADGAGGHPVLVDRDGYVLGLGRQSNLPLIRGATERGLGPGSIIREKNILDALDVLDLCDATRLGSVIHLQAIDAASPDRLVLSLAGGEIISMGRDQLKERLEKLVDVLKTAQDMGQSIKTADLTVLRNVPVVYRTP
jgi:cell division septal protein FtsQ